MNLQKQNAESVFKSTVPITEFKISVTNNNIKIFQAAYVVQKTPTACYNIVATKSMESIL